MTETTPLAGTARGTREPSLLEQRTPSRTTGTPTPDRGLLRGLIKTARPKQWVKNVLVVAAPAAAGQLFTTHALTQIALVFALFTACAAAVYLINDARDAEADRAHPTKRHRPVAAGQVPVPVAYAVGGTLAVLAPAAAAWLSAPLVAALRAAYLGMQLAYCVSLKHVLVVDLAVVTTGFLMRAMVGGLALGIPLSRWFLITTGFGALFMVSAKRYSEAVQMAGKAGATRCSPSTPPATCASCGSSRPGSPSSDTACGRWRRAVSRTPACCPGGSCPWSRSSSRSSGTPSSPIAARRANPRTSCCATAPSP
jgi:decaprenyl-phosphate phosphoribosyltransferase